MVNMLEEVAMKGRQIALKIDENNKNRKEEFEQVDKFRYLGSVLTSDEDRTTEIKKDIIIYQELQENKKQLKNNILIRRTKINMYKTIIRPKKENRKK